MHLQIAWPILTCHRNFPARPAMLHPQCSVVQNQTKRRSGLRMYFGTYADLQLLLYVFGSCWSHAGCKSSSCLLSSATIAGLPD